MTEPKEVSRLTALAEVVFFVALAIGSKLWMDQIIWRFSGPITLIGTLLLLTIYLNYRGESWRNLGLPRLPGLRSKLLLIPQIALTLAAFFAVVAATLFGGDALGLFLIEEEQPLVAERWGDLRGNLPLLLLWLGIVWTSAAFGEEMFFRGFLITRLQRVFAGLPVAAILAVLLPALVFGFGHMYYQGVRGFFVTGAIAIAFGTVFLLMKKNLWPIIFVHGAIDTMGFLAHYFGWDV